MQKALLAVTNSDEGRNFVDQNGKLNTSEYISTLFPLLPQDRVSEAANLYASVGNTALQRNAVRGESTLTPCLFEANQY